MNEPQRNVDPARVADIGRVVEQYLAALDAGQPLEDTALCQAHFALMPELAEELKAARRVRAARRAAANNAAPDSALSSEFEPKPALPQRFGEFELLEHVGQGGFATVFKARHLSSGKIVAIKILAGLFATSEETVARFRSEAAISQRLRHPNIVNVRGVGEFSGRHFLVMDFVDGPTLRRLVNIRGQLPAPDAIGLMSAVTDACVHAHATGVIHRDIKPENILIEHGTGKPKLSDFGLARRLDATLHWTATSQQLGTPEYMAPEQIDRRLGEVGPPCDVYSLGATLYHILTGRPPFPRDPRMAPRALLQIVLWGTPTDPRKLNPQVPQSLARLCLACLEKMPEDRCTAPRLADDLRRLNIGQQIRPHRVATWKRVRNLRRRRPGLTLAVIALLFTLSLGVSTSTYLSIQAKTAQRIARENRRARIFRDYFADMAAAQGLWETGETGRLSKVLSKYEQPTEVDPRGFEWHFLRNQLAQPSPLQIEQPGVDLNRLAFDSAGNRLGASDSTGILIVWDLKTGGEVYRLNESVHSFAFSRDGKYCVVLQSDGYGTIKVHQADDGTLLNQFQMGLVTTCMALNPAKSQIAAGNVAGEIVLAELPTGRRSADFAVVNSDPSRAISLNTQHGTAFSLKFSPDGTILAAGMEDGTVVLRSATPQRLAGQGPPRHSGPVTGVAFSKDGTHAASQSWGVFDNRNLVFVPGQVIVWNVETGEEVSRFSPHPAKAGKNSLIATEQGVIPFGQFEPVFSGDGTRVFTTGDKAVNVWNAATGKREADYAGHDDLVLAVAMDSDSAQIAGAGANHMIRVWSATGNLAYSVLCAPNGGIRGLNLGPDGHSLATVCDCGFSMWVGEHGRGWTPSDEACLTVWNAANGESSREAEGVPFDVRTPQFGRDGQSIICGGLEYSFAAESNASAVPELAGTNELLSPDGTFIARWSKTTPTVELVDRASGQRSARLNLPSQVSAVSVSPDSQHIAIGGLDATVTLWSRAGVPRHSLAAHIEDITVLAFSPDSEQLASGGLDRQVHLWDVESGERLTSLFGHRREVSGIAFTQDGARLATSSGLLHIERQTAGGPGEVILWDAEAGQLCIRLSASADQIYSGVAISPDGSRIYAGANPLRGDAPGRIVVWTGTPAK